MAFQIKKQTAKLLSWQSYTGYTKKESQESMEHCECNFFVLCYYFCLELISSGSSIVPAKRSIENHSTVYTVFRGKGSFSISRFRFFLVRRIGAINLRYIFEVSIFVQKKKKLYKYLYVHRMHIYTHIRLFSIAISLLLLLEKNIKKKKRMNEKWI